MLLESIFHRTTVYLFFLLGAFSQGPQPGRRNVPGGGESQVDELIWGSDVDSSSDPRILQAKAQLFEGAAGTLPVRTEGGEQFQLSKLPAF